MATKERLYTINEVSSAVILNNQNRAVQGFVVRFTIESLNEDSTIEAERMDSVLIDELIRTFISNRLNLEELGG